MKTTYTRARWGGGQGRSARCLYQSSHFEEMIMKSWDAGLSRGGTLSFRRRNILQIRGEHHALSCRGSKGLARSPRRSIRIERRKRRRARRGSAARALRRSPSVHRRSPMFQNNVEKSCSPHPSPPLTLHSTQPHSMTACLTATALNVAHLSHYKRQGGIRV